ncbi:MAG: hypothetical protein DCC69_00820 [Hyphomicrobiales bacterium]|nr:MAG: hypothetical protein DCC69_00820 [Hyphomicrobiales bacterium]
MTMARAALPLAAAIWLAAGAAQAACPQRLGVSHGDTLESIARACGISVETLRGVNPGLDAGTLRPGTFVVVPRPALPSPQLPVGRRSIEAMPPLVPPATGISPSTTVIAPPKPPVFPRFDIPGMEEPPGHLPPRPGHFPPVR